MQGREPGANHGYKTIGQVVGPHGVKGGLKVRIMTDFLERFELGRTVWIDGVKGTIKHVSFHKDQVRIVLDSVRDRDAAESLRWKAVEVPENDEPELEEDEFLTEDLIGLKVFSKDGRELGLIDDVLPSPAHDILVVGEGMIPVVREFIKDIDLDAGTVTVELIPGLFPEAN